MSLGREGGGGTEGEPLTIQVYSLRGKADHEQAVWPSGQALSPFLTGRLFVRRTYFGQFDEL